MKKILTICLLLAASAGFAQTSGIPALMSYQGHVADASGTPIGSDSAVNRTVTFQFYDVSSGGTPLYAEEQVVTISGGDFSVLIGNGSGVSGLPGPGAPALTPYISLPSLFNGDLYLGITVDDGTTAEDPEIAPRQQIVSTAYAFRATIAESLADAALSTSMLADSAVTSNKIGSSQVTTVKIADANIVTAKIADANVTAEKLADGSVTNSKLANASVTANKIADGSVTPDKLDTGTMGIWSSNGEHVHRLSGNVGIGQSSPGFPLNFANAHGNKISLYGNSGSHYGLGTQSNLLQLYTSANSADIAFGYGSSSAFTEIMRVRGNGNVGIGTQAPAEKLHVNGGSALIQNTSAPALKLSAGSSASADLGLATASGNYSSSAAANDTVLRASAKLHLQSGNGSSALTIDTANRTGFGTQSPASTVEVAGVLQARDSSVAPDNGYHGTIRSTRPTNANQHINLIRSGSAAWSIGYEPGSTTFGIGQGSTNDSSFSPYLRIHTNGTVGIGTGNTTARLNVGSVTTSWDTYGRLTTDGATGNNSNRSNQSLSIRASGSMLADEYHINSDERIKTALQTSDGGLDLETLTLIQITDYQYKDWAYSGSGLYKKVLAQQVEEVFPQAVTQQTGVIPDIYQNANASHGWILLPTSLKAGDRVRIIDASGDEILEVLEIRPDAFRTNIESSVTEVFVYGREVPDFRSVDYDAISMLNVSATQELYRKIIELENDAEEKDTKIGQLETRLMALEQLLNRH